jgi:hypothetical protein
VVVVVVAAASRFLRMVVPSLTTVLERGNEPAGRRPSRTAPERASNVDAR